MTRKEQIEKAAHTEVEKAFEHRAIFYNNATLEWRVAFQAGAEWADANPIVPNDLECIEQLIKALDATGKVLTGKLAELKGKM